MGDAINLLLARKHSISELDAAVFLELAAQEPEDDAEQFIALAVSPGGRPADDSPFSTSKDSNWVAKAGGLPKYIREIAHALVRKGMATSHAIATAVNRVKKLAATSKNPKVKAAAAAAVAEFEAKAKSQKAS